MPCRTYSKCDGMSLEDSEQEWYDLINILSKSLWLQYGKLLEHEWKQDNQLDAYCSNLDECKPRW